MGSGMNSGTVVASQHIPAQNYYSLPFIKLDFNGVKGETVRIRHDYNTGYKLLNFAEVVVNGDVDESLTKYNLVTKGETSQSSTCYGGSASRAVDGGLDANWHAHSTTHTCRNTNPWWKSTFGGESNITSINVVWTKTVETFPRSDGVSWDLSGENIVGSEVRVRLTKQESLSLTEVQVIGSPVE